LHCCFCTITDESHLQFQKASAVAKQTFPLLYTGAYSREQGAALNEATGGLIPMSRLLRSAVDLWRSHHAYLVQQGYAPLDATRYLLNQTEKPAQPQAQPQAPQPSPLPQPMQPMSPFQHQPPIRGAA
jgi:hypothetical protein